MGNVTVEYSDFAKEKSIVEKISFELIPNTTLELLQENESDLSMTMTSTDGTVLSGTLDLETIAALIRSLVIFKNQIV